MTTTTPTHDLAIARAERDAWQSTCEELHRAIAGRDVEIEAHLGRIEAADQRARSCEAALTAEREAGKGMRASVYENRGALVDVADDLHVDTIDVSSTDVATRCGVAIANLRFELAAIRDLVAPGNPQGAVVDAVRAMIARWSADERDLRAAIARAEKAEAEIAGALSGLAERLPVTPPTLAAAVDAVREAWDADRSAGARSAAEMMDRLSIAESARAAAVSREEKAERSYVDVCDAIATERRERDRLRAEVAELTVTRNRLLAREHEDGRLHAQLRAEVAELRARPVLTEERLRGALFACADGASDAEVRAILAALGPVMLPAHDRAEELCRRYHDSTSTIGIARGPAWSEYSDEGRAGRVSAMHKELTALAKLSPDPVRRVAPTHVCGQCQKPAPSPAATCRDHEWIGVDLDGTLAHHDTWRGLEHIGDPVPAMLDRVRAWLDAGVGVRILTARVSDPAEGEKARAIVKQWCRRHLGRALPVTCVKDMHMTELWDDRAVAVRKNTGHPVTVAPTLVAVSDEELGEAFDKGRGILPRDPHACLAGIRAVRAKLGAAEVTEERVKEALKLLDGITSSDDLTDDESLDDRVTFFMTSLRASAAKGG